MPPNIKFPRNIPLGDDLIAVAQSASQTAPPPLTLDQNNNDDFFLHDIEENVADNYGKAAAKLPPPTTIMGAPVHRDEQLQEVTAKDQNHEHRHHADRVIRHLASQVSDESELGIDERRLSRTVRDAGEYAYGVIACEVWMLNEDDKLVRPRGGWWHNDKIYQNGLEYLEDLATKEPAPMMPGVDLPGILWAESHHEGTLRPSRSSFLGRTGHQSTGSLEPHPHQNHHHPSMEDLATYLHLHPHTTTVNPHALLWRDLHSIAQDPDSAKTDRLGQLVDAGLCAAAGVPFHVNTHHRGLVIYFARSHTRTHLLSNVANDAYLRASAELIGHAAALSQSRRASVEARRRQNKQAVGRFRSNMLEFHRNGHNDSGWVGMEAASHPHSPVKDRDLNHPEHQEVLSLEDDLPQEESGLEKALNGIRTWWHKCRGGNLQVPPALTFRQTLWTILGAFCGLLVLSSLNEYYKMLSDEDYFLLIGPFGALMTLQYGLTSAPASQPRNAILGQAVSGAVSLAFTYIPETILATWLRRAVGPAVAIGVMVKLGVTHPPAGAHAVLYASGQYNFGFYALVVLSSAISVIPATIVNNLSSKRQYPTYWSMIQFCPIKRGKSKKAEE